MQVTHDLAIGGLQRIVADICLNIDKSKFNISVSCLRNLGEFTKELVKNNIKVYSISSPSRNDRPDYLSFFKLYRLLKGKQIDILHTHNTHPFIDGTTAGRMARIPVIIHTDHAREFPDKRRYMVAERILSHFVDKVVAVSESVKQDLIYYEKMNPKKITILWNGIDPKKFNCKINEKEKKKELNIENRYPILGVGVRLTKQKGIIYLLKAIPRIISEYPKTILIIAGSGDQEKKLKQEAIKLQIDKHVRFLGPRLDIPEVLSILNIYVLPSLWEGMPLAILEAMAAKKPIVATAVDGTEEAIFHEHSGLLVPPQDSDALADAILRIVKNQDLARFVSNNAYRRFQEYFTVQKMTSRYEELYLTSYYNKLNKY
jgi:glycosyltransferase involved in cell wall biosynthesis